MSQNKSRRSGGGLVYSAFSQRHLRCVIAFFVSKGDFCFDPEDPRLWKGAADYLQLHKLGERLGFWVREQYILKENELEQMYNVDLKVPTPPLSMPRRQSMSILGQRLENLLRLIDRKKGNTNNLADTSNPCDPHPQVASQSAGNVLVAGSSQAFPASPTNTESSTLLNPSSTVAVVPTPLDIFGQCVLNPLARKFFEDRKFEILTDVECPLDVITAYGFEQIVLLYGGEMAKGSMTPAKPICVIASHNEKINEAFVAKGGLTLFRRELIERAVHSPILEKSLREYAWAPAKVEKSKNDLPLQIVSVKSNFIEEENVDVDDEEKVDLSDNKQGKISESELSTASDSICEVLQTARTNEEEADSSPLTSCKVNAETATANDEESMDWFRKLYAIDLPGSDNVEDTNFEGRRKKINLLLAAQLAKEMPNKTQLFKRIGELYKDLTSKKSVENLFLRLKKKGPNIEETLKKEYNELFESGEIKETEVEYLIKLLM